ncbi:DUF4174 domain-containing protein [Cognatishimia sp. F0-27]|uniref:DUF4174 domain-containing protein n=1 Tax=Cognatishimia sp. F0-27 TaxID=2816855 RepID=UPI001D0CC15F|nr:DUF4174 domain-containing protein [Cognatishimia sp. F0-27]
MKQLTYCALLVGVATTGTAQGADDTARVAETAAIADTAPENPEQTAQTEAEAAAETAPRILVATETSLDDWLWIKRPVVVFADSPADPRYVEQMQLILDRLDALDLRDVVVITDTDPAARSSVRTKLRARGFMLVVIAKDGTIVTRKPAPWDVREISRSIDKLPLRIQEIRDRRDTARP